jgi:hypothetical protein
MIGYESVFPGETRLRMDTTLIRSVLLLFFGAPTCLVQTADFALMRGALYGTRYVYLCTGR